VLRGHCEQTAHWPLDNAARASGDGNAESSKSGLQRRGRPKSLSGNRLPSAPPALCSGPWPQPPCHAWTDFHQPALRTQRHSIFLCTRTRVCFNHVIPSLITGAPKAPQETQAFLTRNTSDASQRLSNARNAYMPMLTSLC
jgi:hypothetical protein